MKEKFSEFEREYFIQTRKEIDTEKHERDTILNFVIAALGALAFALFKDKDFSPDKFDAILKGSLPVGLAICGVSFITVLIAIRFQKLRQIADRWTVLNEMLKNIPSPTGLRETLESTVCRKLQRGFFHRKDTALLIVLSLPFYLVLVRHAWVILLLLLAQFAASWFLFQWNNPLCKNSESKPAVDVPDKQASP